MVYQKINQVRLAHMSGFSTTTNVNDLDISPPSPPENVKRKIVLEVTDGVYTGKTFKRTLTHKQRDFAIGRSKSTCWPHGYTHACNMYFRVVISVCAIAYRTSQSTAKKFTKRGISVSKVLDVSTHHATVCLCAVLIAFRCYESGSRASVRTFFFN